MQLHILSWNICGVTSPAKLVQLKGYVICHRPDVIFLQEAFPGRPLPVGQAPSLSGYIPYVHMVRNGLLTYIHSSLPHRLLRTSADPDTTSQLFEVTFGDGVLQICNVYSAPARLHLAALPPPTVRGFVYMGDFNARHPALGDCSSFPNSCGLRLLSYIRRLHLTRWDTGGATHSHGGTLDHVLTSGLVASRVQCSSVPALFSDHLAIRFCYSLPAVTTPSASRLRITVPPKYCPTYVQYITTMLPSFQLDTADQLYCRLVSATHDFYRIYVTRPHIQRRSAAHSWMLDERIREAKEDAERVGSLFQANPSPELLHRYRESRDALSALLECVNTESWQRFTDGINQQTSVATMWRLIHRVVRKSPPTARHHTPAVYARQLVDEWSQQSTPASLPVHVQDALSSGAPIRRLRLISAMLQQDDDEAALITDGELRRALSRGKASSPGDDGVTYAVLRLLHKVPGNPLLRLYNLCLQDGCLPEAWTTSTIIPIPKPGTMKFRPISLTSCFCKVMERILLTRLLYRLQDRLSPRLFGFLPQRSTHHGLVDLYSRLSRDSVVAFVDLKSAFDVANRDIILDQLADFGIKGNLLRWIRAYLSNRTSRVFFSGAYSPSRSFSLGTPQGGVLSPFLFNVLMHRLLSSLPDIPGTTVTCYADDLCIHSTSPRDLQLFLTSFSLASSNCGLIVSPDKSRIFSCRPPATLPAFTVGGNVIPLCTQYRYLGAPVKIPAVLPARRQTHPIVQDLLDRLHSRLRPLQWLTNNSSGISIPVARTVYITFIRSVVDYLSPALIQLPRTALEPLEKFQNRAMRVILGCPVSTRIVNMQRELCLSPLVERIFSNVTRLSIKCLHFPHLSPHYSQLLRTSLGPNSRVPPILPGGRALIKSVCSSLRSLGLEVPVADVHPGPPPWLLPTPLVSFTPTTKTDLPPLQLQLALEHVATVTSSIPDPHRLYTDGSLQSDGAAGAAVFSPDLEPPTEGWVGRRLHDHSSSTLCELYAILDAVSLVCQKGVNAVIVCDSKPALLSLSALHPTHPLVVQQILSLLALTTARHLCVHFTWVPSHVGLSHNATADRLAKEACRLPPRGAGRPLSLPCCLSMVRSAALLPVRRRCDAERPRSVTINHYESVCRQQYKYRRRGLMVRRHNVVSARLRLGYRPPWQVAGVEGVPPYTECRLCSAPLSNTLEHYCLACPTVRHLLPRGQPLDAVCRTLLCHDTLEELLLRHPRFGGFS